MLPKDSKCAELHRKKIEDLLKTYPEIFIQNDLYMGYTTTVSHKIDTIDRKPVSEHYRRIPPSQYQEAKNTSRLCWTKNIIT